MEVNLSGQLGVERERDTPPPPTCTLVDISRTSATCKNTSGSTGM